MYTILLLHKAGWQSGYAAACKAVYAGSIPASASINSTIKICHKKQIYIIFSLNLCNYKI